MSEDGTNDEKTPANEACAGGNGGIIPPINRRFGQPEGNQRGPGGRSAGATICDWLNVMGDWKLSDILAAGKDEDAPATKRIAAGRLIGALVEGDDFDRICDRTDGKPKQAVELNSNAPPLAVQIITPLTKRNADDPANRDG
jgi:hypothetical protein